MEEYHDDSDSDDDGLFGGNDDMGTLPTTNKPAFSAPIKKSSGGGGLFDSDSDSDEDGGGGFGGSGSTM